jgi:hypothetical protein
MILTVAIVLVLLGGNCLLQAWLAMRRQPRKRGKRDKIGINVAVGIALLVVGGIVAKYGLASPTAFTPRPDSNCTYGLGAGADGCPAIPGKVGH